jgi:hypothetical protein
MYELYDPCTVMFFFRNKHIMIDLGTGNNNKINWAMNDKQEFIDIVETVYRGARKGRGLVVSPKGTASAIWSHALRTVHMHRCVRQSCESLKAHLSCWLHGAVSAWYQCPISVTFEPEKGSV